MVQLNGCYFLERAYPVGVWESTGTTVMPKATDYRRRAEECVQLAQTVRSSHQRTMLLHIAETWLRLAEHASVASDPRAEPATSLN